jgi:hypothetical protein
MNTKPDPSGAPAGKTQHAKELDQSLEKSTAKQPETFRDEANEEKVVEIPPDKTKDPIRGIDAPEEPGR